MGEVSVWSLFSCWFNWWESSLSVSMLSLGLLVPTSFMLISLSIWLSVIVSIVSAGVSSLVLGYQSVKIKKWLVVWMSGWVLFSVSSLLVSLSKFESSCLLCKLPCLTKVRETISQRWVNKGFCLSKSHHKSQVVCVMDIDLVLDAFIVATPLFFSMLICLPYIIWQHREENHWFRIDSKHHANVINKFNARERLFNLIVFSPSYFKSVGHIAAHFIRIIVLIVKILSKFHKGLKKLFKNSLSLLRLWNLLNQKEKWYLSMFHNSVKKNYLKILYCCWGQKTC